MKHGWQILKICACILGSISRCVDVYFIEASTIQTMTCISHHFLAPLSLKFSTILPSKFLFILRPRLREGLNDIPPKPNEVDDSINLTAH